MHKADRTRSIISTWRVHHNEALNPGAHVKQQEGKQEDATPASRFMHNHLNRKRADLCRIRIISAADSLALRECSASELEAAEELVWQLRAAGGTTACRFSSDLWDAWTPISNG